MKNGCYSYSIRVTAINGQWFPRLLKEATTSLRIKLIVSKEKRWCHMKIGISSFINRLKEILKYPGKHPIL